MMTSFQSLESRQLVVGVDGVGARSPSILPFGLSTVGDRDLAAHILQRQALGDEFGRIDLDADRGFCWPPMMTWRTPEIWLICCASWASTASLTVVSGSVSDVADNSRIGESAGLTLR
jgi:hypothetical protein